MGGKQRVYKNRIKSTQTLKKVFRAMELIAASRIGRARTRAIQGTPYANTLAKAVSAVVSHLRAEHPLLKERHDTNRVAILVVTSDRGMAGAYSASVLREAEHLMESLESDGKVPVLYVVGRRGASYFNFRGREVARVWDGHSDSPKAKEATEIADLLRQVYHSSGPDAVCEVYTISTHFVTMVRQVVEVHRLLPIEVIDTVQVPETSPLYPLAVEKRLKGAADPEPLALYEFEPNADEVLAALLPLHARARVHNMLLHAAASELASRQRAMHTATDNAEDLIRNYTRLANSARQAEITQEISEIVSGADALASS
ncbi:MAG TPA: F0F1 ATP synthase subunit gamma [Demequina sp.]|nr:F0F1 ATP synthase subunit gamma [Demequina sp.]